MDDPTVTNVGHNIPRTNVDNEGLGPSRRLVQILDVEDRVAQQTIEALQELRRYQQPLRKALADGATVSELLTPENLAPRDLVRTLLAECSSAVQHARAEAIRELIDVEGLSMKQVARAAGHPRQLIKRLYDTAREARRGEAL
jgi:hypothetical protein